MMFHGSHHLLCDDEKCCFQNVIIDHGHNHEDFEVHIREEQESMDMHDIDYTIVIIAHTKHLPTKIERIYRSKAHSKAWIDAFKEDLRSGVFHPRPSL